MTTPIHAILHHPGDFASRSGMGPLAEALQATCLYYDPAWQRVAHRSWRLGHALRRWGIRHYGSEWNSLVPMLDERRLARALPSDHPVIAHFLWAEFAAPRKRSRFRRGGGIVVGTFHASARRQPTVIHPRFKLDVFDGITLMSESQRAFFLERNVPADRIRVILHGVDAAHFKPAAQRPAPERALRALLIGSTERDHVFMADVLRRLPDGVMQLSVCTPKAQQVHYEGVPNCRIMAYLSSEELLALYQSVDLLCIPMLDCTANNAVLESMACGTPVMVNRVGGIPEYVDASCNMVMERKQVDEWVDRLVTLARDRDGLQALRPRVRVWAERFDWPLMAAQYRAFYAEMGMS